MVELWTAQQVLSLSPDASSTKRGQALAQMAKWPLLGQSEQAVWGECKGSGKKPYRAVIDLGTISGEPAFRCSCPSRKFPCKHALGLLLLWTKQAGFAQQTPPAWVAEWLDKRAKNQQDKSKQAKGEPSKSGLSKSGQAEHSRSGQSAETSINQEKIDQEKIDQEKKNQQARKRLEKRTEKVAEGLIDLNQWLHDIMRSGLADLANRPYRFWDQAAARLIDAQAPGLARRVKDLAGIPHAGKGWPERMLKALGQLYLLGQGFSQLESLAPMMQAEIYKQVGFPQNKDDLRRRADAGDPLVHSISDTWHVLGKVVTEEDALKIQRVWLWGMTSQKAALILSFAHGRRQPLDTSLMPGECFEGRLIFYPGTGIQRALVESKAEVSASSRSDTRSQIYVKSRSESRSETRSKIGVMRIDEAIATYAHALSENPWLAEFPLAFSQVWLRHQSGRWYLEDAKKQRLPISPLFEEGWEMLAMSGGRSLCVFGEWDGQLFFPLSAWSEKTFVMLGGKR